MNSSVITNIIAVAIVLVGYWLALPIVLSVGLFALSGAVTNWLAVHMLFEKVPGLYGSGVVLTRFEDFKSAIGGLIMTQFFTDENIDRFLLQHGESVTNIDLTPIIEKVEMTPAFDALVTTIEQSAFGGMLSMLGGTDAITPLKQPFIDKMKLSLIDISRSETFVAALKQQVENPDIVDDLQAKIGTIVEQRIDELTPQLVKEIIQNMIKKHLGWLVVWGGVFGGLIGLAAALIS